MNRSIAKLAGSIAAVIAIAIVSPAAAAAETAVSSTSITPRGILFREVPRSVDAHMEATVLPDPGTSRLRELINTRLNLPTDLSFSTRGTPVCEADIGQKNPENANRPTAAIIAECPGSVVGEGTAVINLAGFVGFEVTDSVLTIFNGGRDDEGNPILLTHGYSATVVPGGFGIIMVGSLVRGVLDVKIPRLPVNSAVSEFTLDLPGVAGRDPDFSRARCSTGDWTVNAVLTLGQSDPNTGQYVNQSDVTTPANHQSCAGRTGRGRLGAPRIKGPKRAMKGTRKTYSVTLTNNGTATVKETKITAGGRGAKGRGSAGRLRPGASKRVKLKVRFTKPGASRVRFKLAGMKVKSSSSVYRVRVR